jgi:hypothetical protein
MARKASGSGLVWPNPYGQAKNMNGDDPDISGGGLFVSYSEVDGVHLRSAGEWGHSNNANYVPIMGGPAAGEENPFGLGNDVK